MLQIAVCDDDEQDRDFLLALLKGTQSDRDSEYDFQLSVFSCGEDLVEHYEDGGDFFDIIFLDIYMKGQTGMETARQIRKYDSMGKIIFTTISTGHALEGYSVFAYNYLVKPIVPQQYTSVFKKAVEDAYTEKSKTLCVKAGNRVHAIHYKDIAYIESRGKIIRIYTVYGNETTCYLKLDQIESMLLDPRFLRSHKSFLVNLDHVISVQEYFFTLAGNAQVPIRQRSFAQIKKQYYEFILRAMD